MANNDGHDQNNKTIYEQVCVHLPPTINSKGAWTWDNDNDSNQLSKYSLPLLEFQIIVIISFNLFFHFIFKRLGFSKLITHITAGLSIGAILNKLQEKSELEFVFPLHNQQTLSTLALFGYMLFLFIIGVKLDMTMILTTGKKAMAVGFVALVAPLIANSIYVVMFSIVFFSSENDVKVSRALFNLSMTESLTAFPVISYLLSELQIINSELGRLALSSAVLSEFLSVLLLTTVSTTSAIAEKKELPGTGNAHLNLALLVLFLICAVFIIRPAMFWVIKQTPEGRPVKNSYIMLITVGVLLVAMTSHWFGQLVLFAPYILGLVTPDGPPLGSALVDKLDTFVSGLLLPLFITGCAARVTFSGFAFHQFDPEVWGVIGLAMVTSGAKVLACLIITKWGCKMPLNDSLAISMIMSAKGIVELATYSFLRDSEGVTEKSYSAVVITTTVQACIIPFIIKRLYDPSRKYAGYQQRNITHLRTNDEFRVLVCIHRPDNISSIIKLLDASNPSIQTPIAVFVLHLIELMGRTTPVFISHQFQTRTVSDHSLSENVMVAFEQYEESKDNYAVSVQNFTAISPPKLMHEDICTLALNKLTSLIIMPFHRKWAMDGSLESENHSIRSLNCSVLDRAPCSVGILIDRARLVRLTSLKSSSIPIECRVAMIFIGGHDDHEAFAYAKRMVQGSGISSLTVIRFIAKDPGVVQQWELMLDAEVLKEVKTNKIMGDKPVRYREEMVFDGPELALRIREMVGEYELMIVGRRHNVQCRQTSGLMEWSEFPELGVVGDLLASTDLESRTSVLVVQQQRMASGAKHLLV